MNKIKPLDIVLFKGKDALADCISFIEWTTDTNRKNYWTHVGIVVDSTILSLPELKQDKMYIYESVLSGTIAGINYSSILPVDSDECIYSGYRAGPQIRELLPVIEETTADVAVCHTDITFELNQVQKITNEFYNEHKEYSYPFTVTPQLGSAYDALADVNDSTKCVFCSEMVAGLLSKLNVTPFVLKNPKLISPIECETGEIFWIKESGEIKN